MTFGSEMQGALEEMRGILDDGGHAMTFTYRGVAYPCICNHEKSGVDIVIGGFNDQIQLTVIVSKADLPWRPTADNSWVTVDSTLETADGDINPLPGKRGTLRGKRYRIANVGEPAGNSHWEIDLVSPTQQ